MTTCDFDGTAVDVVGVAPKASGKLPLAIWLSGTHMPFNSHIGDAMKTQMNQRSFVAVTIHYPNQDYPDGDCKAWNDKGRHLARCIDSVCKNKQVTWKANCALGLAVYGHSQGAQLAQLVGDFTETRVTAVLAFAGILDEVFRDDQYSCFHYQTPRSKRRILQGENDGFMAGDGRTMGSGSVDVAIRNARDISGYTTEVCPGRDCIQQDGSGYYVALSTEVGVTMTHMWFINWNMDGGVATFDGLATAFTQPKDTYARYGVVDNLDWLALTALNAAYSWRTEYQYPTGH